MRNWCVLCITLVASFWATGNILGQPAASHGLDTLRTLTNFSSTDQRLINEWIRHQYEQLEKAVQVDGQAAFLQFRRSFAAEYKNSKNTSQFQAEFVRQLSAVAAQWFGQHSEQPWIENTIGRILLDLSRIETLDGLLAGVQSQSQAARYYCIETLGKLRTAIAADPSMLDKTIAALGKAGAKESNPVLLSRIYIALAFGPQQIGKVFDVYATIFESRLDRRRNGARVVDFGEIDAFEFFRTRSVVAALAQPQKVQLATLVATFMRLDAERFDAEMLRQREIEAIMRRLDGEEAILAALSGNNSRGVRDALAAGGYGNRPAVLKAVFAWIGDPKAKTPGTLNTSPFNLPIGAP